MFIYFKMYLEGSFEIAVLKKRHLHQIIKRNEEKCEHTAIRAFGLKFTVWPLTHIP